MTPYEQMLAFLSRLEAARIGYRLERNREEGVMVLVATPGERWEIEFMIDGSIVTEIFRSDGKMLHGPEALDRLFAGEAD